ncbi:MAG: hypothetical protein P8J32_02605 [bacterium]|jgi:uncharacterized membrane protein|nr:hypothetical protein [bacterium]
MPKVLISVGQLIDQSWEIYKRRFSELITISGWLLLSAILIALSLAFYPTVTELQANTAFTGSHIFGVALFSVTSLIISPIISFWVYTSITRAAGAHASNKKADPRVSMKEGWKTFFPALLTTVMVVLMILLAVVIGMAPPAIVAAIGALTGSSALIILGNIALVIGIFVATFLSIKWMVYYILAPIITILDGAKAKQALATSRQMIEGKFWAVLARVTIPKIVFTIVGVFMMSIAGYLVSIFIDAAGGFNIDLQLRISTITTSVVPVIIAVIINPLIIISDVLLLKSLKS